MDDPHTEVERKPQPGAVQLRKKIQNLPTSCTNCRLNPHNQLGRFGVYGIYKRSFESSHKRKYTNSDHYGHWRQEQIGAGPDYNLSCSHSRSRDQHSIGAHPRKVRWTVYFIFIEHFSFYFHSFIPHLALCFSFVFQFVL